MRSLIMTKPLLAKWAALQQAKDSLVSRIYAHGNHDDRFSDCKAKAWQKAPHTVIDYDKAVSAIISFEREMISQGRAWRSTYGIFQPNFRR